jgi:hypothetical protein
VGSSRQTLDDIGVRVAELLTEQTDDHVPDRRQHLRGIPRVNAAAILSQRHVADIMQLIFHAPMLPDHLQQAGRIGPVFRQTGDAVNHFGGRLAVAGDGAGQTETLPEPLPEFEAGQDRSGFEGADFDPTPRFLDGLGEELG